ncbi:MAG: Asp-tRNA(Asn)/Glu-tRNA(Gln) amidotransferase subunit GatB [Spirochaetales bacterium]|nr:Asp-tRNA(Asn)/Glu-tRNA(Gln) amidotransferase subunit GatB [Spirochaetales bacterium]
MENVYQSFVGLEIHIQLLTATKVFCGCRANFGDEPNTNVCPVCMGYPGVLPALNGEAIAMAYTVARSLNCELNDECVFDRKNYFYPDLPKNYQISQFHEPVGRNGYLDLEFHKKKKRVRIHEIHLEEDAGKMIHAGDMSLLDYNRAGTPLLEIVTEPDLEIGEEAEVLLQELRRMVRYLAVCDGNMEEGSMRCDANVSVNVRGRGLGSKVEIKNLNSSRFVRKALNYEIERQEEILERGGTVAQQTRLWNENRDLTESMRTKESSHDYRYFPEPDLPHFRTSEAFLAEGEGRLVELPAARRARFVREYGLGAAQADFLCDEKAGADFFESTVAAGAEAEQVAIWLAGDVRKQLNRRAETLEAAALTPKRLADLLHMLADGTIHGKIAKQVLELVFEEDKDPAAIIRERGWEQITDRDELGRIVDEVLSSNPRAAEQIAGGDTKPVGFLVGRIMKATSGRADPHVVQTILAERFAVSTVEVYSFGGAIAGRRREDGLVVPGDLVNLDALFRNDPDLPADVSFEEIRLGRFLSEEITPSDWAALIARTADSLDRGSSRGIVIGHGTDTLSYTASLLYWFFADTAIPVVLTASTAPTEEGAAGEAASNLRNAVGVAAGGEKGIHVVYGERDYFAVNLKFERAGVAEPPEPDTPAASGRFRNWNTEALHRAGRAVARSARSLSQTTLERALEMVIGRTHIVKVYPGLRGETVIALMDAGIRFFVLELFDTGTANLRESPFSLRKAFSQGREKGVQFFCTSQQEGAVDFSEYVTAHELWREGAVPMGELSTEAVWTRLIAAQIEAALGDGDDADIDGDAMEALLNASADRRYTERVLALMED